jgi:hypothetical protein
MIGASGNGIVACRLLRRRLRAITGWRNARGLNAKPAEERQKY